jgi:hypothetical protein
MKQQQQSLQRGTNHVGNRSSEKNKKKKKKKKKEGTNVSGILGSLIETLLLQNSPTDAQRKCKMLQVRRRRDIRFGCV